jgi:bacteriocin biosynthesis cyclodehydratase domain-containing protein
VSDSEHRDARAADRAPVVGLQGGMTDTRGAPSSGAPRFRLRASIEAFFASDGDVYLLRGGGADEHVVRRPTGFERRLLEQLAREGLEVAPGSAEEQAIAPLAAAGAVVRERPTASLGTVDAERFARQLPYLEDFGDPIAAQRRLRGSSIAIVGCGGLGTWALGALASVGVGRFVLVDDDVVELSNLNRQILYRADAVGQRKVDLAAAWLAAFDPSVEVVTRRLRVAGRTDLEGALRGCDALVLTADWPPYELVRWANQACLSLGVPFITAGQQPPVLKVGPTYLPGRGACFSCHERQLRRDYPLYEELADQRRRHPPPATTLGPASGVIGALLALEMLHLLVGHWPLATHDRVLVFDMRTLTGRWEQIDRDPDCGCCGLQVDRGV